MIGVEREARLLTNTRESNFYKELINSLDGCKKFYFSVAFINYSGLQLLLDKFKELEKNGTKGKIITTTYLNFTEPKPLRKLQGFSNIETKIYIADKNKGFHTKGYIFEYEDYYKIIVGSSNITQSALKTNIEWNVEIYSKRENDLIEKVLTEFNTLWDMTNEITIDFLEEYEKFIKELKLVVKKEKEIFDFHTTIKPNKMQIKAMENLNRLRNNNQDKALVISATGTGKTYMSAFDIKQYNAKRMLFLVHREEILKSAESTYKRVFKNIDSGIYTGNQKDMSADYLFSSVQTISRDENLNKYTNDYFDYIVIDEAHRAAAPTYQKILNYFKPKFLLGMTATPERMDNVNVFDIFDNNIAVEIRLRDALEEDLVVPFHYFGITDITTDLSDVNIDDIDQVAEKLNIKERVDFIIEKMEFYGFDNEKRKCLGFCVNKKHARYMSEEFNAFGYNSIALTGDNSQKERQEAIKRLEDDNDKLEFIFTVDIFNEGVDIPSVNIVLMLRPTQSPIIFTQQLGRGLRKLEGKDFLTVLDFIGNHRKSFLIPIALNGSQYLDKDSLKVIVDNNFEDIPGCTHIHLDKISKERILNQLDQVNFNSMKYLKDEYNTFKKFNGGKVPKLVDYIGKESAPDPVKFINNKKSYTEFLLSVEEDVNLETMMSNEDKKKIKKYIDGFLPIKRINEFAIIKYLLNSHEISLQTANKQIKQYINDVDIDTINHSFNYLNQDFMDPAEKSRVPKCFTLENNVLKRTQLFNQYFKDEIFREVIKDSIQYGLLRYQEQFGSTNYGVPFLKLYEKYHMKDLGLLVSYDKTHSSIRGSGLWTFKNDYYLFVDLKKGEDIKESINYKDKIIDKNTFQWETQNSTSQNSERGLNIINNVERNINLRLFVRKYKKINGQVQPYIYLGRMISKESYNNKPIRVIMEFESTLPDNIYNDLTRIVDN